MLSMLSEIWALLACKEKFWLLPIIVVLMLLECCLVFRPELGSRALFTRFSDRSKVLRW